MQYTSSGSRQRKKPTTAQMTLNSFFLKRVAESGLRLDTTKP
jgi:hypothetical protein